MDAKSCQKWQKTLNESCQFWQLNIPESGCIAKDKQGVIGLLKLAVLVSDSGLAGGERVLQRNIRKWTPPITETSTMWTRVRGPELFPVL